MDMNKHDVTDGQLDIPLESPLHPLFLHSTPNYWGPEAVMSFFLWAHLDMNGSGMILTHLS